MSFTQDSHRLFYRHGAPFLVIPSKKEAARLTISLYLPQTIQGRLAQKLLLALVYTGLHKVLLPSASANRDGTQWIQMVRTVCLRMRVDANACGALLCNPHHGLRAVLAFWGEFPMIAKVADRKDATPIQDEYRTLSKLQGRPGVPPAGRWYDEDRFAWFDMPYLQQIPRLGQLRFLAMRQGLLRSWETQECESLGSNALFTKIRPFLENPDRYDNILIRKALTHGDFTPWNLRWASEDELVAIDWEYAEEDGIAGFDHVYCLVQDALLVSHIPKGQLSVMLFGNNPSKQDSLLLTLVLAYLSLRNRKQ